MRFIDHFSRSVEIHDRGLTRPSIHGPSYMALVGSQVKEALKSAKLDKPNPELVQLTLGKFLDWTKNPSSEEFGWMDLAILCWALDVQIGNFRDRSIMESTSFFQSFHKLMIRHENSETLTPYLWQGLFNTYLNFQYHKSPLGRLNWESLRSILRATSGMVLRNASFKPLWLENVLKYEVLLEENAAHTLARQSLAELDTRLIDSIANDVEIPPTSWFWPDILLAQVREITSYSDDRFKKSISLVLPTLKLRKECLDAGLAAILDRYSKCDFNDVHSELKDTALELWKSPTLERQRDWERVSIDSKKMVQRWLVVEDIRDFFLNLRKSDNDDSFDRRRFEFWMQFLDQITFAFLALGPETREIFENLLKGKIGRYAGLSGTLRSNNAFIMRVGRVYIVEFSELGKMFAYEESKIRPHLSIDTIRYERLRQHSNSLFKDGSGNSDGIAHRGGWEERFISELSEINIRPDKMDFEELIARYNLKVESAPSGTQLVRHHHEDGVLATLLRQNNFNYKYRQGYYRNPRIESRY